MIDKALVKKTGVILDITTHYFTKKLSININLPEDKSIPEEWTAIFSHPTNMEVPEGDYYTLSDGNKYDADELIIGVDNIRDYKITNQIKINE